MTLTQYQIDIFGYTPSQVEHINGLLSFAHLQGFNQGFYELQQIHNKN